MENKLKGGSTSKVVVTSEDGTIKEFVSKPTMEKVIAESNEAKYHASEGGSQLHKK